MQNTSIQQQIDNSFLFKTIPIVQEQETGHPFLITVDWNLKDNPKFEEIVNGRTN